MQSTSSPSSSSIPSTPSDLELLAFAFGASRASLVSRVFNVAVPPTSQQLQVELMGSAFLLSASRSFDWSQTSIFSSTSNRLNGDGVSLVNSWSNQITWPNAIYNQTASIGAWSFLATSSVQPPTAQRYFLGIQTQSTQIDMSYQGIRLAMSDWFSDANDLLGGDSLELDTSLILPDTCESALSAATARIVTNRTSRWFAPLVMIGGECSVSSGLLKFFFSSLKRLQYRISN
jgi:hypothetical protein